ncbi:hypothetical protein [Xylophilus sp. ASV27]|uniref:hypothetical protein n=1 Tax=Xylophilus sp. ASV27 TaxID=2795129 RepID=UPI0018EDAFE1|nr:hypothetical protein [Xylophilus sp. ASV27]
MTDAVTILDDGEFYVELHPDYQDAVAPGFLLRRCAQSSTAPNGFVCLGGFDEALNGSWTADVKAHWDPCGEEERVELASDALRMDAIAALWRGRKNGLPDHA